MIDQIDQKSYVEARCIKYKQLSKGQKDNGRRETMTQQTINKQKNFKCCLFVCLFGCFHDSEHDTAATTGTIDRPLYKLCETYLVPLAVVVG